MGTQIFCCNSIRCKKWEGKRKKKENWGLRASFQWCRPSNCFCHSLVLDAVHTLSSLVFNLVDITSFLGVILELIELYYPLVSIFFFGVDTCTLYIVYWILLSLHNIRPVQPMMHTIFVFPLCNFILLRIFLHWTILGSRKYMAGYAINLCVLMTWNDECKWYFQIHLVET